MKLFQRLLVAPAALGLLAPISANANEVNLNEISNYSDIENIESVSDAVDTDLEDNNETEEMGYLEPGPNQSDVSYTTDDVDDELAKAKAGDRSGLDDALEF